MVVGIGVAVAMQDHVTPQGANRVNLHLRRGGWHHDHRTCAEFGGAHCHALCMVARRRTNHTFGQLLSRQVRHLVIGTTQLEAEDGLLVFTLQQHGVAEPTTERSGRL
jgi:hypothetical protein